MNLLLLFESDFTAPGRVALSGRRLEHVREVLRSSEGESLSVGLIDGGVGVGVITRLTRDVLEMDVRLDAEPPPPIPLTLVLSLPRPLVLSRVLATVTSMGVKRIYLINSNRVEKSFWGSPRLHEDKLHEALIAGLEQAKDTALPSIEIRKRFRPFVEDELPAIAAGTRALVAHPGAPGVAPHRIGEPVTLAVGPEGGYIPSEVEMLERNGFEPVNCGERILRVESVIPALIGRLGF